MVFKAIKEWFTGGKGSVAKQAELDTANAAPYKIEAPKVSDEPELQAAPVIIQEEAGSEVVTTNPATKPAAPKAKETTKAKAEGTAKPKAVAKPKSPKKPKMTVAK